MAEDGTPKTALGLKPNLAALLCYSFGFITGLIFLFLEKENRFVRFHALQSVVTFLGVLVVSFLLGMLPFLGMLISLILTPVTFILWVFLMYKAYQGEEFKLPYVGNFVDEQLSKAP